MDYKMMKRHRLLVIAALLFTFPFLSARVIEPVQGKSGMVVAGHPEAAAIGAQILRDGGSAMDAVVATAFALGVAEPYGSGIGGKCTILYYEAKTGKTWFVDGMDVSGRNLDAEAFAELPAAARREGPLGVGIPGMVAALDLAHKKWGSLSWKQDLEPAAALADTGFLVVPGMEIFFERRLERIQSHPETMEIYMPGGELPHEGQRVCNPDLARTIREIANKGRAGFYEGTVAGAIVDELQRGGSYIDREDFRNYQARLFAPLEINWNGLKLVSIGPPAKGGATLLLAMKVIEDQAWEQAAGLRSADNLDQWGRALRHVYPVIEEHFADIPAATSDWKQLIAPEAIERLRAEAYASKEAAVATTTYMEDPGECTTHFVVADKYGNVASVTQSLSHHFGSGVIAPGTGVLLNNSLKNFSYWDRSSPNAAAPLKRPTSTIAPTLVLKDGRPILAIGLPGGQRIPSTLFAVLVDHLAFGRSVGQAIADTRFHLLRNYSDKPDSTVLQLEAALPPAADVALEKRGWTLETITDSEFFGGVTAISISPDGTLTGWADWRRTNAAEGF